MQDGWNFDCHSTVFNQPCGWFFLMPSCMEKEHLSREGFQCPVGKNLTTLNQPLADLTFCAVCNFLRSPVVFSNHWLYLNSHHPVCTNAISKGNNRPDINRTIKHVNKHFPRTFLLACRSWELYFCCTGFFLWMNRLPHHQGMANSRAILKTVAAIPDWTTSPNWRDVGAVVADIAAIVAAVVVVAPARPDRGAGQGNKARLRRRFVC